MKTNIVEHGKEVDSLLNFKIIPLKNNLGEGSYLPVEVDIINPHNYYVPDTFFITKSLELTEKNNKPILLKPNSEGKLFWIMKIPEELEKGYLYTSVFEIQDLFHKKSIVNISYSKDFDKYTLEEAKILIESYSEKQETSYSKDLNLDCKSKDYYLNYQVMKSAWKKIVRI